MCRSTVNCLEKVSIIQNIIIKQVPGVAENRPSVLRGDCLKVIKSGSNGAAVTLYTGYVHKVELDRVKLGFSKR